MGLRVYTLVGALVGALIGALTLTVLVVARPFPEDSLSKASVESLRLRDRHGRLLREVLSDTQGRTAWRTLDEVSPWVPLAFIAAEDHRFLGHSGLDPMGIARAVVDNVKALRIVAGGSTLSQQLVGLVLHRPRTFGGKALEAVDALRLERAVTKDEILEQYFNRAPFGHSTFGIEAAARLYFDKPSVALTLAESALLAGLPRAPSVNNPFTDLPRARAAQARVLRRLLETGSIDAELYAQATSEPLRLASRRRPFEAPHFTEAVLARTEARGELVTTLELDLQAKVEEAVEIVLRSLEDLHVEQGAVVVLDNASGDVLAWVGSRDFFATESGQVDMVTGLRQSGSTLKPFVYGLALESGLDASTPLPDFPLFFETMTGDYRPRNYDRRFHGWVKLREALACSYNVPAVWLADRAGPGVFHTRLRKLGFESLVHEAAYYGLGLVLGNAEVRLLDLANAYRTLANGGLSSPVRLLADGPKGPQSRPDHRRRVMPIAVAELLTDILSDRHARAPAFGQNSALDLPFPAAAKTGTSTDFTDNWTVGYSSRLTVAVWVGNFDGRPMAGVSGITGAGRLWNRVMRLAHSDHKPGAFATEHLVSRRICMDEPAKASCLHFADELFLKDGGQEDNSRAADAKLDSSALRIGYPDDGDRFIESPDVPAAHAELIFRLDAQAAHDPLAVYRWTVDGHPLDGTGPTARWRLTPGRHQAVVALEASPTVRSRPVSFEVLEAL